MKKRDINYKYLFGPVPSRRLGRSLGVDLIPLKTCTYDCIYCQLGRSSAKTVERKEYIAADEVLAEIEHVLAHNPGIDYFTVSGSGEPTLNSAIGEIIEGIKKRTDIKVAVITNGSLLYNRQVRDDLSGADLVMPTISAVDPEIHKKIHRPHKSLELRKIIEGLKIFSENYPGEIWAEVFIVSGINDNENEMKKLAYLLREIGPDRIQLNTSARLAAEFSYTVTPEKLATLARLFTPVAEIIASTSMHRESGAGEVNSDRVLAIIKRRPMTAADLAQGLGVSMSEIEGQIRLLLDGEQIQAREWQGQIFYSAKIL